MFNLFPNDKLLHFIVGVLIYAISSITISYYAIILVIIVGIGKEVYDKFSKKGTADLLDAVVTIFGGLIAMISNSGGVLWRF